MTNGRTRHFHVSGSNWTKFLLVINIFQIFLPIPILSINITSILLLYGTRRSFQTHAPNLKFKTMCSHGCWAAHLPLLLPLSVFFPSSSRFVAPNPTSLPAPLDSSMAVQKSFFCACRGKSRSFIGSLKFS